MRESWPRIDTSQGEAKSPCKESQRSSSAARSSCTGCNEEDAASVHQGRGRSTEEGESVVCHSTAGIARLAERSETSEPSTAWPEEVRSSGDSQNVTSQLPASQQAVAAASLAQAGGQVQQVGTRQTESWQTGQMCREHVEAWKVRTVGCLAGLIDA